MSKPPHAPHQQNGTPNINRRSEELWSPNNYGEEHNIFNTHRPLFRSPIHTSRQGLVGTPAYNLYLAEQAPLTQQNACQGSVLQGSSPFPLNFNVPPLGLNSNNVNSALLPFHLPELPSQLHYSGELNEISCINPPAAASAMGSNPESNPPQIQSELLFQSPLAVDVPALDFGQSDDHEQQDQHTHNQVQAGEASLVESGNRCRTRANKSGGGPEHVQVSRRKRPKNVTTASHATTASRIARSKHITTLINWVVLYGEERETHIILSNDTNVTSAFQCWVAKHRRLLFAGELDEGLCKELNDTGFKWGDNHGTKPTSFDDRIDQLTKFVNENGQPPTDRKTSLGNWLNGMKQVSRGTKSDRSLSAEQAMEIIAILGPDWNAISKFQPGELNFEDMGNRHAAVDAPVGEEEDIIITDQVCCSMLLLFFRRTIYSLLDYK